MYFSPKSQRMIPIKLYLPFVVPIVIRTQKRNWGGNDLWNFSVHGFEIKFINNCFLLSGIASGKDLFWMGKNKFDIRMLLTNK